MRPGTRYPPMPAMLSLSAREITSEAADKLVMLWTRSRTAIAASSFAQPVVDVVAGVLAARSTSAGLRASPHIDLAGLGGGVPVMKARRCAAPARARYVAGRGRSRPRSCGIGNGRAAVILPPREGPDRAKEPGRAQPQRRRPQPGSDDWGERAQHGTARDVDAS